ncbi:MAG: hypothetical protein K2Y32_02215 [Candidatus Obscuribacterales bacterium]|nr:hypothetical protein [Candidatus Obscuribacterales bacterium]
MHRASKISSRGKRGGVLAESPLAFFVMSLVIFFMISMFSLLCGYATLNFACSAAAREAGSSQTKTGARAAMQRVGAAILTGPLGAFGGITPRNPSGLALRTFRVPDGGSPEPYDVATGGNVQVDQKIYSYTYVVDATYSIQPILFPFSFQAKAQSTCAVEHPEGIGL